MYKGKISISKFAERLRPVADVLSVSLIHEDSDRIPGLNKLDNVGRYRYVCPFDGHAWVEYREGSSVVLRFSNGCHPGALVHEFGHAVFGIEPSDPIFPSELDEWEWFGVESLVARKIQAFGLWAESSSDYNISSEDDFPGSGYEHRFSNHDYEFGDLSEARQKEFLEYALQTESKHSNDRYNELRKLVS